MALKLILLRNKLSSAQGELDRLRAKDGDFKTREAELETALGEVTDDTTAEDQATLEEKVNEFEKDKADHEKNKGELERQIGELEQEIEEEEKRSKEALKKPQTRNEKGSVAMNTRTKFFGMSHEERDHFFARDDVKEFLQRARDLAGQKRAVSGAELGVPDIMLELVKEKVAENSKLYKHINAQYVPGKARQIVMGAVPEAIWTEMCDTLNELALDFSGVEVDGYKVGGYIPVCNAILADSDIALATEIIGALGKGIGIALDKAILYGTGTKMPLGIVTRIMQTSKPSDYPRKAREWANLSASNAIRISGKTDLQLFKALVEAEGAAKGKYSGGTKFWAMNDATYAKMKSNSLSINAAGAIAAGMNMQMPVINGAVEILEFIPDGVIIGGYGDMYLLAEREGTTIGQSEHVRFIQDQTVFKGTARYDGQPVIAEAFVVIDINGNAISASAVTFTADTANQTEAADDTE